MGICRDYEYEIDSLAIWNFQADIKCCFFSEGVFEQDLKRAQMLMDILHEQLRENSECTLEVTEKHK